MVDNGIGLPKENRSRLLEPYVTTREKGTGLGLAIVGRIVEEHGGTIELRDAAEKIPGQRGAWVRVRIAAAGKPDADREPNQSEDRERVADMSAEILIVDDEADIRDLVAGILQDEGYDARTARNSDDALAAIQSRAAESACSSTSGCRAASSTACNCSTSSSRSSRNCRS